MKRLKTAVIGLGHQGLEDHIPALSDSQFAELKAVCDIDEIKLEDTKSKLGINGYREYQELLDSEELDFVIVATPHSEHASIVKEAAKRRVHVLKEKPFARNLDEAFALERVCRENDVILSTTCQRRFNPIYTTYFQLADKIGTPFFTEFRYTFFVENPQDGWRADSAIAGGGCIIDMGYHMIDMIIWYFGLPSNLHAEYSAKAKADNAYSAEDTACILFSYDNGLNGSLTLSRYCSPKTETIKVIGDRGIVEIERGKIKRLRNNGDVAESLIRENSWPIAAADQIDNFCRIIRGERENVGDPRYHLQHVSFAEACYKSKTEGRYINPKELLAKYGN